tara:strand:- start:2535 stop:3215 length:681 start_codon:yes stop_codon:yes gene_type:complete
MRIVIGLIALIFSMGTLANDLYVTQSGATLTFDVLQDGQNNQIGNSTTSSSIIGATSNLNIDQVGNSNILTFDVNGANFTGTLSTTGNSNNIDLKCDSEGSNSSCGTVTASITMVGDSNDIDVDIGETADASNSAVTITSAASDDSNVIAATVDGTSAILTITVDGDTNNWLIDIDGDGDVNGHTYIHTHTGGIADVDIVQSGVYDNMVTLTTSGDNHNIDIIQRD